MKKSITEICELIRGVTFSKGDAKTCIQNSYMPVFRSNNIQDGRLIFDDLIYIEQDNIKENQILKIGDVVITASTGSKLVIGKAAQLATKWTGSFGAFCIVLRPKTNLVDPRFFGYYFQTPDYRKAISHMSSGANINNLKKSYFDKLKIEVPFFEEQKRIVRELDAADALRQKRKQAIALLDDYLKAVFMEMFGGELESGSDELRKYLKVIGGGAFKSTDFQDIGVPVIKIGTVNKGFFDLYNCSFLPSDFLKDKKNGKYIISPGDLLISLTGTVGKEDYGNVCFSTAEYPQYLLNQRVAKLDFDRNILTREFLFFFFQAEQIKSQLTSISRGVRQANISNEDILSLKISLPAIEKQETFSNIVQKVKFLKQPMMIQSVQLDMHFNALMQVAFK